ncbi:hypothetical protein HYH03_007744 [Edaphochlamys debaryana]|uniref:Uncharacterized protein n=1 Tax=Edaphochlamys debaryana TaxID=47281 RepID=A0A835Y810_9CHLO|nr:hypothetical protein HYH03_007744 [Edaphochlamys debaryana]|eukprot:KAG2494105.1 hypothetical protein HYH03_007744 [Edaphochlamys debaryana]
MSGSRSSALLRQFGRFAGSGAASASSSTSHGSAGAVATWGQLAEAVPSLLREAVSSGTAVGSLARSPLLSGAAHAHAVAPKRVGMIVTNGVLSRGAATGLASSSAPAGGIPALRRLWTGAAAPRAPAVPASGSSRGGGLLGWRWLRRAQSTAAGTLEEAAAQATTAAARKAGGGAALSEGLSTGARRAMATWLGVCTAWVYSMVVLGGVTRLTRSGLSMTEWKLAGERPPLTEEDWVAEFAKYRASPEFQKVHRNMTLEEFKFIYWMEYAHRMWGRILGVFFAVPASYFLARGWINGALGKRLGLLFFMGGTQGLVGWWMVRSGLEEPEHEWAAPRVSPYRLAAHLVSAFAIYATLAWTTLDLLYPAPATAGLTEGVLRSTGGARRFFLPLAALIAVTATSGAFVAGLDAGRAYNTWPDMNGKFIPDEYVDPNLGLSPIRNLFENTAAVQFNHRTLATVTLLAVLHGWAKYARGGRLPPRATRALHGVGLVTAAQFALGVYTLLQYVPTALGSAHQANALNLFTAALALLHACRPPQPSPAAAAMAPLVTPAAVLLVGSVGYLIATQNAKYAGTSLAGALTQSADYSGPTMSPATKQA